MNHSITIDIDSDLLQSYTDTHLATLWHVAQANPAPMQDRDAGALAESIGREIIRRFLGNTQPELWAHQGKHHFWMELIKHCRCIGGNWVPVDQVQQPAGGAA